MVIQALLFLFVLTGGSTSNSDRHEPGDNQLASSRTSDLVPDGNQSNTPETQVKKSSLKCSWESILKELDLRENNDRYTVGRPVKDHRHRTKVYIEMKIFAILDVNEANRMLVSYNWVYWRWNNEHIRWNPNEFCGQKHIFVPTKYLWMPDLTIEEMTDRDKTAPSSHLKINHDGIVEYRNGQVVDSTCRMDILTFPFDTQNCSISFKSIMHSDEELLLFNNKSQQDIYEDVYDTILTSTDWSILDLLAENRTVDYFGFNQTLIIHNIVLRRRPEQYVLNFMLPLLFFVCLDFASFLLSDTGGEKIAFKVTILLSVTLMQILLNEVLPPSTGGIPLIVIFCVWIFTMMLLSLLETIFVRYLIDLDQTCKCKKKGNQKLNENPEEKQSPLQCCFIGSKKQNCCASAEGSEEDQFFPKEDSSSPQSEMSLIMEKALEELGEIRKSITILSSRTEDDGPGCWTRLANIINRVFAVSYIIGVILFMKLFYHEWIYNTMPY
ncbi:hypothetical protein OJAV_G00192320 [Oryzias javanicus]|uniref:Neurotransmitter-gated ion-channel ligand-binding domain-containing protein n=1 Tax=Oryzias javanicus TaxID=123683 RepID=A0A3S2PFG9_ORYJA|nr:hypothetical protein OJAV_G00192320 [Oryzias javanicus]